MRVTDIHVDCTNTDFGIVIQVQRISVIDSVMFDPYILTYFIWLRPIVLTQAQDLLPHQLLNGKSVKNVHLVIICNHFCTKSFWGTSVEYNAWMGSTSIAFSSA